VTPPSGLTGKIAEAREQMALQPNEPYWPYSIAKLEVEADSLAAAERDLEAALERNPDYVPALALQTSLDYRSGRHTEAIRRLEAARARSSSFPNGLPPVLAAGLALHYDALDRVDLAREAIAAAPAGAREAEGARVYLTLRGEHPDSAVAIAKDVLDDDPRSAVNQNNWGITRLRAGDPVAAEKAFRRAIELDPALAGPYYNLAILEKYYRFDDDSAAKWFGLYWDRSHADPDGLASIFGKTAPAPLAGGKDD
jgi:tetratricopeptide (TPR) repeat protein